MYTADWISATSFQACPDSTVHLLLHLSISPLDSTQIPVAGVVPLNLQVYMYLNTEKHSCHARSLINCSVHT